jgi:branched-chain amino acid transport system substrate-binding protein
MNGDVAEGYAVGQVVQQIVEKIKSLDNAKILADLHSGSTYTSVQGPVKFDDVGENVAAKALIFQWQGGKFLPVYPTAGAKAQPEYPKADWPK